MMSSQSFFWLYIPHSKPGYSQKPHCFISSLLGLDEGEDDEGEGDLGTHVPLTSSFTFGSQNHQHIELPGKVVRCLWSGVEPLQWAF